MTGDTAIGPAGTPKRRQLAVDSVTGIVGYRLRRAQLHIFKRFIARFADLDLRPAEYSVLALIAANPGSKQTEIAHALGIKRANFVALAGGLEARGLIERRPLSGDRRSNALYLTGPGGNMMVMADAEQADFEAECVARLGGEAARDELLALLDRLVS